MRAQIVCAGYEPAKEQDRWTFTTCLSRCTTPQPTRPRTGGPEFAPRVSTGTGSVCDMTVLIVLSLFGIGGLAVWLIEDRGITG